MVSVGIGFGRRHVNGKSCILPVLEESYTFIGLEYLGLYPYIEYEKISGNSTYEFWVIDQVYSSRYTSLGNWLYGVELRRY